MGQLILGWDGTTLTRIKTATGGELEVIVLKVQDYNERTPSHVGLYYGATLGLHVDTQRATYTVGEGKLAVILAGRFSMSLPTANYAEMTMYIADEVIHEHKVDSNTPEADQQYNWDCEIHLWEGIQVEIVTKNQCDCNVDFNGSILIVEYLP